MKKYTYDSRIAAIHSLRINYKSLAAEAAINRKEMRKAGPNYRSDIALHRRTYVRQEARYTNLALAFLRGRTYKAVENNTKQYFDLDRLQKKISRHWPEWEGGNKWYTSKEVEAKRTKALHLWHYPVA